MRGGYGDSVWGLALAGLLSLSRAVGISQSPVRRRRFVLNRAGLGMEVMHERNAHNFPLDLAAATATPVALTAPAIG